MTDETHDVEARLREVLRTAAPTPPRQLDPADVRRRAAATAPRRPRRRQLSVPVLASAAVLVLVVGLWSVAVVRRTGVDHDSPADAGLARVPTTSAGTAMPTTGTPRQQTVAAVERALTAMPTVPGTHRVGDGRPYGLTSPPTTAQSDNLVGRNRVFTGPGTLENAKDYIAAHLPPGFSQSGTGYSEIDAAQPHSFVFYDLGRRWQDENIYSDLNVQVTYVRTGDHQVGVRYDAQAVWLPKRPARQMVSLAVTGVSIDYVPQRDLGQMGARRVRVERGAATSRRLARAINGLPIDPPGTHSCPIAFDDATTMVFHGGGPDRRVVYRVSGCGGVSLGHGPDLMTDDAFLAAYDRAIRGR